jgi:hypothetical protein
VCSWELGYKNAEIKADVFFTFQKTLRATRGMLALNEMHNHRHHHHHHFHAANASLDSPSPNLQEGGKECGSKASLLSVKTASTEGGGAPIHLTF